MHAYAADLHSSWSACSLSVCLTGCLSACLSLCLPAALPSCLSVSLSAYLPASLRLCLPVCLSATLLPCQFVRLPLSSSFTPSAYIGHRAKHEIWPVSFGPFRLSLFVSGSDRTDHLHCICLRSLVNSSAPRSSIETVFNTCAMQTKPRRIRTQNSRRFSMPSSLQADS